MKREKNCPRVGITGGIGSGKSTVCRIFETLGIPVYDADSWAKWLITNDYELRREIVRLLGPEAYKADGSYDREYVAGIVFEQADKLAALNALVHPAVERHSSAWHEAQAAAGAPYTLKEAALLIESGGHRRLDLLILVNAPADIRLQRVMQRDGLTEEAILARMASQMPEDEKAGHADFIVENDGNRPLIPQVLAIHREILVKMF